MTMSDCMFEAGSPETPPSSPLFYGKASSKPCKSKTKSINKYVPHKDKPPQLVERRNARERRRVESVNSAFVRLRRIVPYENRHKRLSKAKTLRTAIDYIQHLQTLITQHDHQHQTHCSLPNPDSRLHPDTPPMAWTQHHHHHHNHQHQMPVTTMDSWTSWPSDCSSIDFWHKSHSPPSEASLVPAHQSRSPTTQPLHIRTAVHFQ